MAQLVRVVKPLELIPDWGQYPAHSNKMTLHWETSVVRVCTLRGEERVGGTGLHVPSVICPNQLNSAHVSGSLA